MRATDLSNGAAVVLVLVLVLIAGIGDVGRVRLAVTVAIAIAIAVTVAITVAVTITVAIAITAGVDARVCDRLFVATGVFVVGHGRVGRDGQRRRPCRQVAGGGRAEG